MAQFAGEMPNVRLVGRAVSKQKDLGSFIFFYATSG
jgi:hypothetical protein